MLMKKDQKHLIFKDDIYKKLVGHTLIMIPVHFTCVQEKRIEHSEMKFMTKSLAIQ